MVNVTIYSIHGSYGIHCHTASHLLGDFRPPLLGAFQVANDSGGAPPEPFDSTVPEAIHYLLTRATWQKTVIM